MHPGLKAPEFHASTEVLVKYSSGAYVTQTVRGKCASSTSSAGQAAASLAHKLYGTGAQKQLLGHPGTAIELWRLMPATHPGGEA